MKSVLTRSSTQRRWLGTVSPAADPLVFCRRPTMAKTAFDRSPDILPWRSSSVPSASMVDDHEIRELTIPPSRADRRRSGAVVAIVIVLTGIAAGLSAMLLGLLLHFIQHVAYDYSLDAVVSPESFLQGVTAAPPIRRVTTLTICGAVAGIGWWAVYRFGRPLVSIKAAVGKDVPGPRMPFLATMAHVFLQIVTVALGSPLGREVAPREMGAVLATWLSSRVGLTAEERRILIACGAGAGLAAIYNVPLGGGVVILEVLLGTFAPRALVPALAASVVGSIVAWIGLGDVPQYTVPPLDVSLSLIAWSIVAGPVFRPGGIRVSENGGSRGGTRARRLAKSAMVPRGFLLLGLLATLFPQLPGNGKARPNND